MPYPTGRNAHYDIPLSNLAVEAFNADTDGVAQFLFPEVGVNKQSDKYYIVDPDAFLRSEDALRAPRTKPRSVQWTVSSDSYYCENYALSTDTPLEDLANADRQIRLRQNNTRFLTGLIRRAADGRVINIVTSGANVGSYTSLSGASKWSATSSADILGQVSTARAFILSRTGFLPNTAILDWQSFEALRRNERLLDLFKYTTPGQLSEDVVRDRILQVDRLMVTKSVKNTANEGQSLSTTSMFGNNCFFCYVGENIGLQTAAFGLRFAWRNPELPADFGVMIQRLDGAGDPKVEITEVGHYADEKVVGKDLGYLITATI